MGEVTAQLEPETKQDHSPGRNRKVLLILAILYLTVWISTRAHFMADTNVYKQAILRHQFGRDEADYRLMTGNPFWDFGHVLWRPAGWLCFVVARPLTRFAAGQNARAAVLYTLLGINFLASIACVLFFFALAQKVLRHTLPAAAATIGLFSADAFLDYAHSGNAYVVGLACLVAGIYFCLTEGVVRGLSRSLVAAAFFALAVLFWFPFAFVLPGAIAAPLLINSPAQGYDRQKLTQAVRILGICVALGIMVYAGAIAAVRIQSLTDLKDWVFAAGHGHIQPGGFRALARLAFSVPRSFINMDRDGMWLKRYLVHDPYAPVSTGSLFALSLWKLLVFYAAAAALAFELMRSRSGRGHLLLLAATVLPMFIFAIFIFEAGSIERYLPLYPFIFLSVGFVLAGDNARRSSKVLLFAALLATAVVNIQTMYTGTLERQKQEAVARIGELIPSLKPNDLVLAVTEQDSLAEFRQNFPLDPINLDTDWRTYDVLEINTERLATWREDLAARVLGTWKQNGTVWVPARFLSATPKPEWNWVEGDDKRIHWTDLPAFFTKLELGPARGSDGFLLLHDSPANREILAPVLRTIQPQWDISGPRSLVRPPRRRRRSGNCLAVDRCVDAAPVEERKPPVEYAGNISV
jgi:hypothetical protein